MSELIRAEEGPTWVRQSSVDHRRTEKDKTSIRTHIVQNSATVQKDPLIQFSVRHQHKVQMFNPSKSHKGQPPQYPEH